MSVRKRSTTSVEVKIKHLLEDLDSTKRVHRQSSELIFFFPQPFYITAETYDQETFFTDRKLYVRLNAPGFTLKSLLDDDNEQSPLFRLSKCLNDRSSPPRGISHLLVHEAKLFTVIFNSTMKASLRRLISRYDQTDSVEITKGARRRLKRAAESVGAFHKIIDDALSWELLSEVHSSLKMLDEHASLLFEHFALEISHAAAHYQLGTELPKRIEALVAKEMKYRRARAYQTTIQRTSPPQALQNYVYRKKALKRYASEVLFLQVKATDQSKRTEHVLYALAAGISMAFATAIAFYGQTAFGNISVSLFVLLVASYMLKDRMKDVFRELFRRTVGRKFPDRRQRLFDASDGTVLARMRERVSFVAKDKIDPEIALVRDPAPYDQETADLIKETQMVYCKTLSIHGRSLRKKYDRVSGLADIAIINLEPWLRHLSSQRSLVPEVGDGETMQLREVERLYHLNAIVRLDSPDGHDIKRYRLVVSKQGIHRIEEIEMHNHTSEEENAV